MAYEAGDVDADSYVQAMLRSLDVRTAALEARYQYNLRVIDRELLSGSQP